MDRGQEKDILDERKSISQDTLPRIRWTGDLGGDETSLVRAKRSCSLKGVARVFNSKSGEFCLLSSVGGPDRLVARQISAY